MDNFVISAYRSIYLIRRVEEEIVRLYPSDVIKSPVHLSIGQEAVSVGTCLALRPTDKVYGTYRSHALYLAKGGDLRKMLAELFGKVTGCGKGKSGSMHLCDVQAGVAATSAVVATTIPLAVGTAFSNKLKKNGELTVCYFGDGAFDEGVFHESILFATMHNTPVLFVCENNEYAIHSHDSDRHKNREIIGDLSKGYGMKYLRFEDDNVESLFEATVSAREKILRGEGPMLFECMTSRWLEHVGVSEDFDLGYRSKESVDNWKKTDQLKTLRGRIDVKTRDKIEMEIEKIIRDAIDYAYWSDFPKVSELYQDIFV